MRHKRYALPALFLALMIVLSACKPFNRTKPGSWTVCLYLCGAGLETRHGLATRILDELTETELSENVTVVVQTGGSRKWHTDKVEAGKRQRFLVGNGELEEVDTGEYTSMGKDDTLADFLSFCAKEYPSEHSAVILWDHGGGPLRGVCFDERCEFDPLTLGELSAAFAAGVRARDDVQYDIVGFDACLMGSLETAVMLANDARYLVASEEIEPEVAWDYTALTAAMGRGDSAEQVAASICNDYRRKCEKQNDEDAVTLAAVDLSGVGIIVAALDACLTEMSASHKTDAETLRRLAYCVRSVESFGGATKDEGRSNLVDLQGMAQSCGRNEKNAGRWKQLDMAVNSAVIHNVNGTATKGANGLSIWYPLNFRREELANYVAISPLRPYAGKLSSFFSDSMEKLTFSDTGSFDREDSFSVTIAPETHDTFFDLYVVNQRVDGGYKDTNVDIRDDWDALRFSYNPAGAVRITLNGMTLDAQTIAYDVSHILFSCPVTLNDQECNLRICWLKDKEEKGGGHYKLLGAWNGIDHVTGLSNRLLEQLKPGDKVGARSLYTGKVRDTITIQDKIHVDEAPMEPGRYKCWFVALDLYGNEYPSAICTYEVTKDGSKLISIQ